MSLIGSKILALKAFWMIQRLVKKRKFPTKSAYWTQYRTRNSMVYSDLIE